jgi:alpha(1,3/1,4) fucosyltransferase
MDVSRRAEDVAVWLEPTTPGQFQGGLFDVDIVKFVGDNLLAPFVAVRDRFVAAGVAVDTSDRLPDQPDGRRHLFVSYGSPDRFPSHSTRRYRELARRSDVVLSAYFTMECPVVEPRIFREMPALQGLFRRLLTWSDAAALRPYTGTPVRVEHFCWPQPFDAVHPTLWSNRDRGFLVMMNANKLPRIYVDELYTARLRAIEFFHRHGELDLYGRNWNSAPRRIGKTRTPALVRRALERAWVAKQRVLPDPRYAAAAGAWRGAVRSKCDTLARYRFALCFENSTIKGWVTEKLFDCLFVGTVPIYWGPADITDWVPADCYIDMRQFEDFAALRTFLHALSPAMVERYREAGRDYLDSPRFDPFRLRAWTDLHARFLAEDTGLAV